VQYAAADMRGTPGEIVDTCLLYWAAGEEDSLAKVMPAVLSVVTGRKEGGSYKDWLTWRLGEVGAVDGAAWEQGLWKSRSPDLLKALLKKTVADRKTDAPEDTLRRIIADRQMRADVRADAIAALPSSAGKDSFLALVDLLGDATFVLPRQYLPVFDPTFPFYGHVGMREARLRPVGQGATTIGVLAYSRLKVLSGQDFRGDAKAWREWIAADNSRAK
jgi:hypothetical protein